MYSCFLCKDIVNGSQKIDLTNLLLISADVAPLNIGHTLLYSEEHVSSFAEFEFDQLRNMHLSISQVCNLSAFQNTDLMYFEHGPGPNGSGVPGCCDHAHIHLLPLSARLSNLDTLIWKHIQHDIDAGKIAFLGKSSLLNIAEFKEKNYVWFGSNLDELNVFELLNVERQYLRKLVADSAGLQNYQSWELYDIEQAQEFTEILRAQLSNL